MLGGAVGGAPAALDQSDLFTASAAPLPLDAGKNVAEADGEFGASGAERGGPRWRNGTIWSKSTFPPLPGRDRDLNKGIRTEIINNNKQL